MSCRIKTGSLPTAAGCPTTIDLPELHEDIGHTLTHYLYTGTYETLGTSTTLLDHSDRTEFKRAVTVCDAAQTYHLPGIQRLAAEEADRLGTDLIRHL